MPASGTFTLLISVDAQQGASAWMEQPTACRPTSTRSSRLTDSASGKDALSTTGVPKGRGVPQIAIHALSPRDTEEQGMTGDASGNQETWSNQEIPKNSQISDYSQNQPKGDRQSGGSWAQVPSPPPITACRAPNALR